LHLSPDERWVAGAQSDGDVFLWNAQTGDLARDFKSHVRPIIDLALMMNDTKMVVLPSYEAIHIWDIVEGRITHRIQRPRSGWAAIAGQHKGTALVALLEEKKLGVWDVETGQQLRTIDIPFKAIKGLLFSPDDRTLFALGDNTLLVIDFASGEVLRKWGADDFVATRGAHPIVLTKDGERLVSKAWG